MLTILLLIQNVINVDSDLNLSKCIIGNSKLINGGDDCIAVGYYHNSITLIGIYIHI